MPLHVASLITWEEAPIRQEIIPGVCTLMEPRDQVTPLSANGQSTSRRNRRKLILLFHSPLSPNKRQMLCQQFLRSDPLFSESPITDSFIKRGLMPQSTCNLFLFQPVLEPERPAAWVKG